jgi:hypothetical protein
MVRAQENKMEIMSRSLDFISKDMVFLGPIKNILNFNLIIAFFPIKYKVTTIRLLKWQA